MKYLLLLLIIISGCTFIEEINPWAKTTTTTTTTTTTIITTTSTTTTTTIEEIKSDFPPNDKSWDSIQDFLNQWNQGLFIMEHVNSEKNLFITTNSRKRWGVQILEEKLETWQDFVDFVSLTNWNVWDDYLDKEKINKLHPRLTESELDMFNYEFMDNGLLRITPHSFENYKDELTLIERDISTEWVQTKRGLLPFYKVTYSIIDQFGIWKSNYVKPLLVYIIPCTENMVVYHYPKDSDYEFSVQGSKKDEVLKKWSGQIQSQTAENVERIDKILDFCGIENIGIENPISRKVTKKLSLNWRYYYQKMFNHTLTVNFNIESQNSVKYIRGINYRLAIGEDEIIVSKPETRDLFLNFLVFQKQGDFDYYKIYEDILLSNTKTILGGSVFNKNKPSINARINNTSPLFYMPYIIHWKQESGGGEIERDFYFIGSPDYYNIP